MKKLNIMSYKIFVTLICSIMPYCIGLGQDSLLTRKMELKVLSQGKTDKIFCFDLNVDNENRNIVQIRYLGQVQTNTHDIYKILTWERVWGHNFHTTGVITLFDLNNRYAGKYILGDGNDLPDEVEENSLIFTNRNKRNCDKSIVTKISFDSISKDIFLKCTKEKDGTYSGDIYSFTNEE